MQTLTRPRTTDAQRREPLAQRELAPGLTHQLIAYRCRMTRRTPFVLLSTSDAYTLTLPDGAVTIEADTNPVEICRRPRLWFAATGVYAAHTFSPAELLQLAELLRCAPVYAALRTWAEDEIAIEAAEAAAADARQKGAAQ